MRLPSNSPDYAPKDTRWLTTQRSERPLFVDKRFQELFHSPSGVLFTFPSRYLFTIGRRKYLALGVGPPSFPQGYTCPVVLRILTRNSFHFAYRSFTFFGAAFQTASAIKTTLFVSPTTPHPKVRFGLLPVRSPLLGELFLFHGLLRWFSSASSLPQHKMLRRTLLTQSEVSLLGNLRIEGCLAPPRSLSQPSTSFIGLLRQGIHRLPFEHLYLY